MIKHTSPAKNAEQHLKNLEYIRSDQTKLAYLLLVTSGQLIWEAHQKGVISDVRHYDSNDEQPYAFIPNQHHLLFYFRKPGMARHRLADLTAVFPVKENTAGEWTVRIEGPEVADRLLEFLQ